MQAESREQRAAADYPTFDFIWPQMEKKEKGRSGLEPEPERELCVPGTGAGRGRFNQKKITRKIINQSIPG